MAVVTRPKFNSIVSSLPGGLHYAWVIVVILALVQTIGASIGMALGVVVIPLSDPEGDFGWSMVTVGAALMVHYFVSAVSSPVAGWLGDRYGAYRLMVVSAVLYAVSMAIAAAISQPWQFFLSFGILLAVTQAICQVPLIAAVSEWFRSRLGLAVGIILASGGIGTALLVPLIGYFISHIGWQATFWIIAAVGGGILILLTFVFRNRPADVGLKPFGAAEDAPPEVPRSQAMERLRAEVFNRYIRSTRAFWNLPVVHGLGCAGHGIVLIYATYIAYDRGVSYVAALVILSILSLCSILSRVIAPVMAERLGGRPVMATALLIQATTVMILFWAQDVWVFYLFAVLFGLGFGGEMTTYLVVSRQYFGTGPIGRCYGFQTMGALFGHAIATGLAGLLLYVTGSYQSILVLSICFSSVGLLVVMTLESTSRVLIPDWEESLPPEARSTESASGPMVPHLDP